MDDNSRLLSTTSDAAVKDAEDRNSAARRDLLLRYILESSLWKVEEYNFMIDVSFGTMVKEC